MSDHIALMNYIFGSNLTLSSHQPQPSSIWSLIFYFSYFGCQGIWQEYTIEIRTLWANYIQRQPYYYFLFVFPFITVSQYSYNSLDWDMYGDTLIMWVFQGATFMCLIGCSSFCYQKVFWVYPRSTFVSVLKNKLYYCKFEPSLSCLS